MAKVEADKIAAQKAAEAEEVVKRKAEADYLAKVEAEKAAAKKAAEAEEAAKKEHEALKKRMGGEAKASLGAAKKTDKGGSIKFKDAVGRKFSFPFHICQTWQGMEDLIKQAFKHVDVIGPHVQEGHYDLIGPGNEIILPSVWERVVEPEWSISMTMWPVEKMPPLGPKLPPMGGRRQMPGMPPPPPMAGKGNAAPRFAARTWVRRRTALSSPPAPWGAALHKECADLDQTPQTSRRRPFLDPQGDDAPPFSPTASMSSMSPRLPQRRSRATRKVRAC
ncbi:protein related to kinetoplast-associated protein KAP [Ophiocordyceps sinensis CO18]|uniref:Protein related to kinetoplast-associated protein KAP n=1 Tax=Ophiocordyceps sinensis (strain Co18 / CGMCC 3.14243) TaxID=911162 RepID=T5A635_OPHSC|nr:protein related to kinetoplast-associated protein KAP [Ophiocordyceps sinensis CO18]